MRILIVEDDHSTAASALSTPPDDANMAKTNEKSMNIVC